jgi:hypothetical protein
MGAVPSVVRPRRGGLESILEKVVLPTWRHRRVADIRRREVREVVEQKAQTARIQGNRVLERISALFTFAVDQDWNEANPAWRIKKPGQERSRDRVLTREELRLSQTLNDEFRVMHCACPEPSQRHAQHRHRDLRSVPLRQGEARGAREVGWGALWDREGQASAGESGGEAG